VHDKGDKEREREHDAIIEGVTFRIEHFQSFTPDPLGYERVSVGKMQASRIAKVLLPNLQKA
jgi:hypothetical protein